VKKTLVFGLAVMLGMIFCGSAAAHFGMVIPSDPMVMMEDGRSVRLQVSFSHPFEGIGMDMERPKRFGVAVNGKRQDLLGALEKTQIMDHAAWQADYRIKRPGAYLFYLEPEPYWTLPFDSVAMQLLDKRGVYKVDMQFALPGQLHINTNNFAPMALLLCENSGRMYGLNEDARVVPLARATIDWASPVIIGTRAPSMFNYCTDPRLKEVCRQLDRVRERHIDLYRLIDEIDFSDRTSLTVNLSGLDSKVRLRADRFYSDMQRFLEFGKSLAMKDDRIELVDLCFDDMVVCRKGKD